MKNIFQTGLALGISCDSCSCVNIDFEWLYDNPMNLLWMDKLIITQTMWDLIMDERGYDYYAEGKQKVLAKATKIIYTILNDVGLVNVISDSNINKKTKEQIYGQISADLELLGDAVKEDKTLLKIGRHCYCIPSLWTLYASLYLSRLNNASFRLSESEMCYLNMILPYKMPNVEIKPVARRSSAMMEVLRMSLPQFDLGHDYIYESIKKCDECVHLESCKDSYLDVIEKQTLSILQYREHDEINQLCMLMDRICSEKFKNDFEIDPKELLHEINVEKINVQRKLSKSYKSFEKWKNVLMVISAGMTLGSFFSLPTVAAVGSAGVLATTVADTLFTKKQKNYKWVNLINQPGLLEKDNT